MVFLSHIKQGDRFPLPLWESWFFSSLGVPIPVLIASDRLYDDLLFLYAHREASTLANELPEESDQFRSFVVCVLI
jgi:hypothetical protein